MTDPMGNFVARMNQQMDSYLAECLNMAIHDGIISEEQANAILPLPRESRTDGRDGPLPTR
jgi:hypothetical protein